MIYASTTLVGAVSAAAAVAGVAVYLFGMRRANRASARDEALALAETRRQTVEELRRRLAALEHGQKEARAYHKKRVRELEGSLEQARHEAREQAYRSQKLYALALEEALEQIRDELDKGPPDVEGALAKIQELLADGEIHTSPN